MPGAGTSAGATSSDPMAITATRGRRYVGTSVMPQLARKPTPAVPTTSPRPTTTSPARASSPASRTFARTSAGARNATRLPGLPSPDTASTTSYFTTASASVGSGAPVMMRTHWPAPMTPSNTSPAATSAMTSSSTGDSGDASASSDARTANPSMAEWANGAMSMSLARSAAATRPTAPSTGTVSTGSGRTCDSTSARASSSEIISDIAFPSRSMRCVFVRCVFSAAPQPRTRRMPL